MILVKIQNTKNRYIYYLIPFVVAVIFIAYSNFTSAQQSVVCPAGCRVVPGGFDCRYPERWCNTGETASCVDIHDVDCDGGGNTFCEDGSLQCTGQACTPVAGGWSPWSDWSACSGGVRCQSRTCDNPIPSCQGGGCSAGQVDTQCQPCGGDVCGDGYCSPTAGEDCTSCFADCPCYHTVCASNYCDEAPGPGADQCSPAFQSPCGGPPPPTPTGTPPPGGTPWADIKANHSDNEIVAVNYGSEVTISWNSGYTTDCQVYENGVAVPNWTGKSNPGLLTNLIVSTVFSIQCSPSGTDSVFVYVLPSTCFSGVDAGLRIYENNQINSVAVQAGSSTSPLKIYKGGVKGLVLVDPTDPQASKMHIQTPSGERSLCLLPGGAGATPTITWQCVNGDCGSSNGVTPMSVGVPLNFPTPGTYNATVNTMMTLTFRGTGAGGGGGATGVVYPKYNSGAGGGSGACNFGSGFTQQLYPGISYAFVVGKGGQGVFYSMFGNGGGGSDGGRTIVQPLIAGLNPHVQWNGGGGGAGGGGNIGEGGIGGKVPYGTGSPGANGSVGSGDPAIGGDSSANCAGGGSGGGGPSDVNARNYGMGGGPGGNSGSGGIGGIGGRAFVGWAEAGSFGTSTGGQGGQSGPWCTGSDPCYFTPGGGGGGGADVCYGGLCGGAGGGGQGGGKWETWSNTPTNGGHSGDGTNGFLIVNFVSAP